MSRIIRRKFISDEMTKTGKYNELLLKCVKDYCDKFKNYETILEDIKSVFSVYENHLEGDNHSLKNRLLKLKHIVYTNTGNDIYNITKTIDDVIKQSNKDLEEINIFLVKSIIDKKNILNLKKIIYFMTVIILLFIINYLFF